MSTQINQTLDNKEGNIFFDEFTCKNPVHIFDTCLSGRERQIGILILIKTGMKIDKNLKHILWLEISKESLKSCLKEHCP